MRALVLMISLAACGADGPPVAPLAPATPGMTISGTVRTGIARDGN